MCVLLRPHCCGRTNRAALSAAAATAVISSKMRSALQSARLRQAHQAPWVGIKGAPPSAPPAPPSSPLGLAIPPAPPRLPPPLPPPSPPSLPLHDTVDRWAYLCALTVCCAINSMFSFVMVYLRVKSCWGGANALTTRCANSADAPRAACGAGVAAPISVLVPVYLPNEQAIIMGTIQHIVHRLEYPGELTLYVVYNTPQPLPIEHELRALEDAPLAGDRRVRVVQAVASQSKAENLNFVMQEVDTELVAIYDADHHPDASSLRLMVDVIERESCDAVQGYQRLAHFLLSPADQESRRLTPLQVHLRARRAGCLAGARVALTVHQRRVLRPPLHLLPRHRGALFSGFFGGSNALWRAS